ncbi:glycosyltransferase family 2 protein [Gelidibacter maritimus]|uniref:Glycosyltransferase family 2 protein n=1 Tax=Gelidibacter maritimus TaxID=2761487 RepID=A0A7W2R452_9FLAO|nr:glycosyltransferase family 2 protein [Gelidibacter maritimus]MBA6152695.1 glycosyltransferase family 2 protein [Gelidibacter maritimus]
MMVSIIIPTYNRAHLIGETLDSVLAQTYTNWECIVVDDESTDSTTSVIAKYAQKDKRIKLFKRPNTKPKGANACRNMGLNKGKGDYVVFFDSDDLMTEDHLEVKVNAIQKYNCDYVITKTEYFNYSNEVINRYHKFDEFSVNLYNYLTKKLNWLTLDVCIKATVAKLILFNENLQSGQEYNYFSKLILQSDNAKFVNSVISLRRHHDNSIRTNLKTNFVKNESSFKVNWFTYLDLKLIAEKRELNFLLANCVANVYALRLIPISNRTKFLKEVLRMYGFQGIYFVLMLLLRKYSDKGYYFRRKLLPKKVD